MKKKGFAAHSCTDTGGTGFVIPELIAKMSIFIGFRGGIIELVKLSAEIVAIVCS